MDPYLKPDLKVHHTCDPCGPTLRVKNVANLWDHPPAKLSVIFLTDVFRIIKRPSVYSYISSGKEHYPAIHISGREVRSIRNLSAKTT